MCKIAESHHVKRYYCSNIWRHSRTLQCLLWDCLQSHYQDSSQNKKWLYDSFTGYGKYSRRKIWFYSECKSLSSIFSEICFNLIILHHQNIICKAYVPNNMFVFYRSQVYLRMHYSTYLLLILQNYCTIF